MLGGIPHAGASEAPKPSIHKEYGDAKGKLAQIQHKLGKAADKIRAAEEALRAAVGGSALAECGKIAVVEAPRREAVPREERRARVAIEHQPVSSWQGKVLNEDDQISLIQGTIALARQGSSSLKNQMLIVIHNNYLLYIKVNVNHPLFVSFVP